MSASIEIRKAVLSDAADIAAILCDSWRSAYKDIIMPEELERNTNLEARTKMFERMMSSVVGYYTIAIMNGTPCGVVSYNKSRDADLSDYAEVIAIYALETYWGSGIGKLMMDYALAELKRLGFERVMLWTFEANARARWFYEKRGFAADGAVKDSGFGNAKEVRYRLELASFQETDEERRARIYPVILSEYNPAWSEWYAEEKANLERLIGIENISRISHFGSTSVPGLTAKPTIDILLEISEAVDIDKLITSLSSPYYIYLKEESAPSILTPPLHLAFLKGYLSDGFAEKVYHIHVVRPGDWNERLLFKDYLIAHPETATEYASLKRELFEKFEFDRDGYTAAKGAFIKEITDKAKMIAHYDALIDENNDPVHDPAPLKAHMDKLDGAAFIEALQLTPDKSVLEIGVGTGRLAIRVCGNCNRFTGIDLSPKTIKRAKENLRDYDNVELVCDDFLAYEFMCRFDVIYSSLTFIHIADKRAAIQKVTTLLNDRGRFVLSISKSQDRVLDLGNRQVPLYPASSDEITALLTKTELVIEQQFETEFALIFAARREVCEMNCPTCSSDLLHCHKLIDGAVSPMKNKSNIIYLNCSVCGRPIQIEDVEANIAGNRKVLLISGTAGAGKTALGAIYRKQIRLHFY